MTFIALLSPSDDESGGESIPFNNEPEDPKPEESENGSEDGDEEVCVLSRQGRSRDASDIVADMSLKRFWDTSSQKMYVAVPFHLVCASSFPKH